VIFNIGYGNIAVESVCEEQRAVIWFLWAKGLSTNAYLRD